MFKLAADRGNAASMLNYSIMLEEEKGIFVNNDEWLRYLKMAVDKGNVEAMHSYAMKFFIGKGVKVR